MKLTAVCALLLSQATLGGAENWEPSFAKLLEVSKKGSCPENVDQDACTGAGCAWCYNDAKKLCVSEEDAETAADALGGGEGGFVSCALADHGEEPEIVEISDQDSCADNVDEESCADADCAWCTNDEDKELCMSEDEAEAADSLASCVFPDYIEETQRSPALRGDNADVAATDGSDRRKNPRPIVIKSKWSVIIDCYKYSLGGTGTKSAVRVYFYDGYGRALGFYTRWVGSNACWSKNTSWYIYTSGHVKKVKVQIFGSDAYLINNLHVFKGSLYLKKFSYNVCLSTDPNDRRLWFRYIKNCFPYYYWKW